MPDHSVNEPRFKEHIELIVRPIPPDTVDSVKSELVPTIEQALREAGRGQLLDEGHIQVEVEQTFPVDQAIIVGLTLLSGIALETYKALVIPKLKERFQVEQKKRPKEKKKR